MTDDTDTTRNEPEIQPPVLSTTIAEYSPVAAGLAELRAQVSDYLNPDGTLALDCTVPANENLARSSRFALVKLRTSLEEKRKEIKARALDRCREIDAEAKRITGEIEALERPFDEAITARKLSAVLARNADPLP